MAKSATRIAEAAIASKMTDNPGRLSTVIHRPVIRREDERATIGPDLRMSPDGKCSCLPRSSSLPRRELSLWSLRRPGSFKLMVLLQWRVQSRWWTARQVTARPQLTDRPQWTARPQVTAQPQLTARPGTARQATAQPVTARQATVRPVTARRTARPQLIHLTAQLFTLMTRRSRTTLHINRRWEWTGREAMEPRQRVDQTPPYWQGQAVRFFPAIPTSINQATLIDFMSMWTLLQRRMEQGMVPDTSASPAVPSSMPAPRHDSSYRRSDTPSGTPERRPRTPEPRTPQRYPRMPVRRVRTPVRQARCYSDSRDSRSRSPLSRSSSVESPTRDVSPVNFTASMDLDDKRSISDDEDDEGEHKISATVPDLQTSCDYIKGIV